MGSMVRSSGQLACYLIIDPGEGRVHQALGARVWAENHQAAGLAQDRGARLDRVAACRTHAPAPVPGGALVLA